MGTEVTIISKIRKVYYTTYASFPTTGLTVGDLAYATDREVLYEWDGSAWQPITIYSGSGAAADIPTAADLPDGSFYYETDTYKTKQGQSGAWATIVDPNAIGPDFNITEAEIFNGTSPTDWTDLDVGVTSALVMLKVYHSEAGAKVVAFRRNGDTDEFYDLAPSAGCALADVLPDVHAVFLVISDASSLVEWKAEAGVSMTIDRMAYIK